MADYWKSQAKKFCDFCKCWIADNRPSVDFHEKGKRHKENVAKRLKEMGKKSRQEHKTQLKVDDAMKKMEEAALKSYMKDVEANADLTSKMLIKQLIEEGELRDRDAIAAAAKKNLQWHEAKTDEDYTYYWNIETGESRWEPPEEGFLSIADQKQQEEKEAKKKEAEARRQRLEAARLEEEAEKERMLEENARKEREKLKSRRVQEEPEPPVWFGPVGPPARADPYGKWKKVEPKPTKPVDLQLPKQELIAIKVPSSVEHEPPVKFKEKIFTSLGTADSSEVAFKKRKLNSGTKRNMRQRVDDD